MKKVSFLLLAFITMISCNPTKEKTIGLQLWSVRSDMETDPEGTIATIGEIGYSFVEAAGYDDGKFYGMQPDEFTALVEKNNMQFL
ncbi:MAG: sugar phosphate isomerase/epimerase, partial [Bacteroidota bacterium]